MEGNLRLLLDAAKHAGADEPDTIVKFITGDGKNHSIESITEALNLASQSDKFDAGIRKGFANVLNFFSKGLEQRTVQKLGNGFVMLPDTGDKNSIGAEFRKLKLIRKMDIKKYSRLSTLVDNLDSQLKRCTGNEIEQKKVIEDLGRQLLNLKSEKVPIPTKAVGTIIGGIASATGLSVGAVSGLIGGVIGIGVGVGLVKLSQYLSSGRFEVRGHVNTERQKKFGNTFKSSDGIPIHAGDITMMELSEDEKLTTDGLSFNPLAKDSDGWKIPFMSRTYKTKDGTNRSISNRQVGDMIQNLRANRNMDVAIAAQQQQIQEQQQQIQELHQQTGQLTGAQAFGGQKIGNMRFNYGKLTRQQIDELRNDMYAFVQGEGYYKAGNAWFNQHGESNQANNVADALFKHAEFGKYLIK